MRNRFYIGEVTYKGEILPGEQPPILERSLFDAVQQKLTEQRSHRSAARNASDHLLTGLIFDDAGNRMVPTHARKAGIRYRYYVSLPCMLGASRAGSVGSVSRVPAQDIEDAIVGFLDKQSIGKSVNLSSKLTSKVDRGAIHEWIARIDVHRDWIAVRLKSPHDPEAIKSSDDQVLSIPWQKPPSKRFREILLPKGASRTDVRPERAEQRARLVSAIARGRRWLDEIVKGTVTDTGQIAKRERCSVRQVNMIISLAFLAPKLVSAAVEGHLPRGVGIERLRDAPAEWRLQFEALGLNPQ